MTDFVNIDIDVNAENLEAAAYDFIRVNYPDWEPADGGLVSWVIAAVASMIAEQAALWAVVPMEVFKQFGRTIVNTPPIEASPATGLTTWTMDDTLGYTIPAGTTVDVMVSGDEGVAFATVDDAVVTPGTDEVTGVLVQAVDTGSAGNNLDSGNTIRMVSALADVVNVELTSTTENGVDAETEDEYLARLVDELTLLTPRPVNAQDFEILLRRVPGVSRVKAIDNWDGGEPGSIVEPLEVGVVALDSEGAAVSAGVETAMADFIEPYLPQNWVMNIGSPTFTAIDFVVTVRCYEGFDPTAVDAEVTAALAAWVDPSAWGLASQGEVHKWYNTTKVRYLEAAEVVNRVAGVNYIESMTIEGGTVDVNLSGRVPVTQPGTIAVTANAGP